MLRPLSVIKTIECENKVIERNIMPDRISIVIEKNEQGYAAYSPEITDYQVQGSSFEDVTAQIQVRAKDYLEHIPADASPQKNDRPIWEIIDEIRMGIPEDVLDKLPTDGAEQHDHYIYGTPKRK
jgi:predicted RNase H-like HicB family nuclease